MFDNAERRVPPKHFGAAYGSQSAVLTRDSIVASGEMIDDLEKGAHFGALIMVARQLRSCGRAEHPRRR